MIPRSIRLQVDLDTSDDVLTHLQVNEAKTAFARGREKRAFRFKAETQLAAYGQAAGLQRFKILQRQTRADQISGKGLSRETVACRARKDYGVKDALLFRRKITK